MNEQSCYDGGGYPNPVWLPSLICLEGSRAYTSNVIMSIGHMKEHHNAKTGWQSKKPYRSWFLTSFVPHCGLQPE